jgi:hypothetical protein
MRKIFAIAGLGLVITAISCSKSSDSTPGGGVVTPPPAPKTAAIKLSKDTIENNGFESVTISVFDSLGNDITATSIISINNVQQKSNIFYPTTTGSYLISAKSSAQNIPDKNLIVVTPAPSPYIQKVLVEDVTGMWCGYCPRVAFEGEDYIKTHPECIMVAEHCDDNGGASADTYSYQYISKLNSAFGVTGFPTAVINRTGSTRDVSGTVLPKATGTWAALGMSITSDTSTAGTISGKVKVKFNVTSAIPMNISIMLVESKLYGNQENYYDDSTAQPYYGTNPIANFEYKNVLRKVLSTNVFDGDTLSTSAIVKNNVYEVPFSFTTAGRTSFGGSFTAIPSNCSIIAFVTYNKANTLSKKGVINVQYANAGTTIDFIQ